MTSRPLTVVVSTFEWPRALDVVLRALSEQTDQAFEVIVADDGSGAETTDVVQEWHETLHDRLRFVYQDDEGWRLGRIRNLAALGARGEYIVFLDGDCLVRRWFI